MLTQHIMSNSVWRFDKDMIHAVTYGQCLLVRYGTPGGDFWSVQCWYEDELIQLDEGWRIRRRLARLIRADGNHMVKSASAMTDQEFDQHEMTSLRREADSGRIRFLNK